MMPHACASPAGPWALRGQRAVGGVRVVKGFTIHQLRKFTSFLMAHSGRRRRACRVVSGKGLPYINYGSLLPF
jgi:hypothetical protein